MADFSFLRNQMPGETLEIDQIQDPRNYTQDQILKAYLRYVIALAAKYSRPTVDQEDLVDEGLMGIMDAIKRFDIDKAKGNPRAFRNLAIVRIKSYMHEFFLRNSRNYRFPGYMARAVNLVGQIRALIESTAFEGDVEDLVRNLKVDELEGKFPKDVAVKLAKVHERLSSVAEGLEQTYQQLVGKVIEVERGIENYESSQEGIDAGLEEFIGNKEFMNKVFANLSPTAGSILMRRLQGEKLETIGEDMGLTRERIRQIEQEALGYIRRTRMGQEVSRI